MADRKWYPATFVARGDSQNWTIKGWSVTQDPRSMVFHRSVRGGKGWTVSDPQTGLAYLKGLPSRSVANALVRALWAVRKRYARRYGLDIG